MDEQLSLDRFGLRPKTKHLPEIRSLLRGRAAREQRQQGSGDTELMRLCSVQLFHSGNREDILHIWRAKTSSWDANSSIEIQLLCGRGLQETVRFLAEHDDPGAAEALQRIRECEEAGAFDDFTVLGYRQLMRDYYEGGASFAGPA